MPPRARSIPVSPMANEFGLGISIGRLHLPDQRASLKIPTDDIDDKNGSHRHDGHAFFVLENGNISVEIDFLKYTMKSPSVIYVHPDQVHRTLASKNVIVSSWSVTDENMNQEYLKMLSDIYPAKPLALNKESYSILSEAISLSLKLSKRTNNKIAHSLLKDSCNALTGLVISEYLQSYNPSEKSSRFEMITKLFKALLEKKYRVAKRPTDYAADLNISTTYLNECVKNTTGYPVSFQIQQRIILEAKRLLYYSDLTVKEIASDLGYDDYPYFSRLFTKVAGMSALVFRNKNPG